MIETLAEALAARGYETLTPVQEAVTKDELDGRDLLVSAQTGSGKTVGFGLAIAPSILQTDGRFGPAGAPLALVIAPTRELALQVMRELEWLYGRTGLLIASCVGGMDYRTEKRTLDRGAHIVVGTPGRLCDHIRRNSLDLSEIRAVVMDEADEMLDLGFREDLEFILASAPAERRTLLFSATVSGGIASLAKTYQKNALRVEVAGPERQHADIEYLAMRVDERDAENAVINVLRFHEARAAIIFANTRVMVARLASRLSNRGFASVALSGELSQAERSHALQAMRDGRARVCVATDVAARGIDLPGLELVIHAELPSNGETLLHRSGRTGRAGQHGTSVLIVPNRAQKKAARLLQTARVTAEWTLPPSADEVRARDESRLLENAVWTETATDDDAALGAALLERFGAAKIAAAYAKTWREGLSAPEELSPPDGSGPAQGPREGFKGGAWFALSIGRDRNAEPRWLLPLVCRAGGLGREDIGAIRIGQTETFVELREESVARFMKALGTKMEMEQDISVRAIEGTPDLPSRASGPARRTFREDGPREDRPRPAKPRGEYAPEGAPRHEKPAYDNNKPAHAKPAYKPARDKAGYDAAGEGKPKPGPRKWPAKSEGGAGAGFARGKPAGAGGAAGAGGKPKGFAPKKRG